MARCDGTAWHPVSSPEHATVISRGIRKNDIVRLYGRARPELTQPSHLPKITWSENRQEVRPASFVNWLIRPRDADVAIAHQRTIAALEFPLSEFRPASRLAGVDRSAHARGHGNGSGRSTR